MSQEEVAQRSDQLSAALLEGVQLEQESSLRSRRAQSKTFVRSPTPAPLLLTTMSGSGETPGHGVTGYCFWGRDFKPIESIGVQEGRLPWGNALFTVLLLLLLGMAVSATE